MRNQLDVEQTIAIIETATLEDVLILNNNYVDLLHRCPDGIESRRIMKLRNCTNARIRELHSEV